MNTYHKRFLESHSSEYVIALFSRYKGAAKEITESWAMLEAAKRFAPNLNDSYVVVVGDGCSPRTGALIAYYTKASVVSIDPAHNEEHWAEHCTIQNKIGYPVQRLIVIKDKIENIPMDCEGKQLVVLWPHSHAIMGKERITNYSKRIDIAMPCCIPPPHDWLLKPHITYEDDNVLSPKKTVHVWGVI
jgi:hypothetical protein